MRVSPGRVKAYTVAALVRRHLTDLVRRRAKAVEAEPLGVAGHAQRAVADQAAAQQRGELVVGRPLGQRQAEALVGDGQLRVAAVDVAPGEAGVDAQVLAAAAAIAARAVGVAQPGHAEAPAVLGATDDLVAEHDRELGGVDLTVAQVQVGAAHRAGGDRQQQLAGAGGGVGKLRRLEWLTAAARGRSPAWGGRRRATGWRRARPPGRCGSPASPRCAAPRGSRAWCRCARRRRCAGGWSRG